jgi:hypothetical protein
MNPDNIPDMSKLDTQGFLLESANQLEIRLKEHRSKADPNRRKKGSKTDHHRRSAEQIEEHKKILLKLLKVIQKEQGFEKENFSTIRDLRIEIDKYLRAPGSISISKSLHDLYKILNVDEATGMNKSEPGPLESEPEPTNLREYLIRIDNQPFEFQPIAPPKLEQRTFMDMFCSSFQNKPNESDFIPIPANKGRVNPDIHSIFPKYRMLEETTIPLMDNETLFFIFYYQPNSYEKYLAARELKKRDWRFHKRFFVWFKRQTTPSHISDKYETGDVYVFDFEDCWKTRKRSNFTFDYKHLEDELKV